MKRSTFFITGTDTSAGKTVFASLLTAYLRAREASVAALKPICSGGRDDAIALQYASGGNLALDEINPWHFHAPLAPLLAARKEKRRLTLGEVVAHIRRIQKRFPMVVIEGAGGLLSPLGEDFNSRDLILKLRATTIVVCPNRLGAANQTLLVLAALPQQVSRNARVVLVAESKPDLASRTNLVLLREMIGRKQVHPLPWLGRHNAEQAARQSEIRHLMRQIIA